VGKPKGKRPLKDLAIYRRTVLKWVLKELDGVIYTGFI
jgi:hypothetical protein